MVSVGIVTAKAIRVSFHGKWTNGDGTPLSVDSLVVTTPTEFLPADKEATFTLHNVTIGIDYHWQRNEDQTFGGSLKIIKEGDSLTAVNTLAIEDYLVSVISSEMKPTAHMEFLKAAAVISRSWVLKQKEHHTSPLRNDPSTNSPETDTIITWQDHRDHTLYDVCADDHCQRYQGLTRIIHPNARNAVKETAHQVLTYGGEVCDCRFSKCCGGTTEAYSTCWEDRDVAYLRPVADNDPDNGHVFCNTSDKSILSQVLNDYDLTTTDFYRWKKVYTQTRLQQLLRLKTGRDFGDIKALRPLTIGPGGRICRLLIEGTHTHLVIGKELTIRAALSESHLYSSAFTIETSPTSPGGIPQTFTLNGRGWGHGVGLCQIGAAVMANKGYTYTEILQHYYPHTSLSIYKSSGSDKT